jgi:hypothetical protein
MITQPIRIRDTPVFDGNPLAGFFFLHLLVTICASPLYFVDDAHCSAYAVPLLTGCTTVWVLGYLSPNGGYTFKSRDAFDFHFHQCFLSPVTVATMTTRIFNCCQNHLRITEFRNEIGTLAAQAQVSK